MSEVVEKDFEESNSENVSEEDASVTTAVSAEEEDSIEDDSEIDEKESPNQTDLDPDYNLSDDLDEQEGKIAKENQDSQEEESGANNITKEKRYHLLQHLLKKSQFYTQYLLDKIDSETPFLKQRKSISKDKENTEEGNSNVINNNSRKRKLQPLGNSNKKSKIDKGSITKRIDKDTMEKMAEGAKDEVESSLMIEQPKYIENGTLRNYQMEGFSWLKVMFENGVNGILADEMGLGKTLQCIALLCHLVEMEVHGPFLVIGPLSTLPNWVAEFKRFAPKIPVILYHGDQNTRRELAKKISKGQPVEGCSTAVFPVIVTSYEVVIRDTKDLSRHNWRYIVVDEGHRLKNHKCLLVKSLSSMNASNRLILTGTPLQNNLSELWSLLNFLLPEIFDSLAVFESWFDITDMMSDGSDEKIIQQEREAKIITTLHKILQPFFLRRIKSEVGLEIPPKKELLVYTPMTNLQLKLYKATLSKDFSAFEEFRPKEEVLERNENGRLKRSGKNTRSYTELFNDSETDEALEKYIAAFTDHIPWRREEPVFRKKFQVSMKLQNVMMQCRRIVNHPYLLQYPLSDDGKFVVDDNLIKCCGKLQVLDQLLKELKKRGHKILLFSQMTMMLDIIEDYLSLRPEINYKRLDGRVKLEDRQNDIIEFNTNPDCFLFLISTRAGSLGLNLASADTVIIYDSDWNPQQDLQAQDRAHRIGQTRPVLILRMVTQSTIDEHIVNRAKAKRKLEKLIMKSENFNSKNRCRVSLDKLVDTDALMELLKKTDYERIHRTETGNIFSQKELNLLLDRSDLLHHKDAEGLNDKCVEVMSVFKTVEEEMQDI